MGEIKQDAMFLPYTINPNVTTTPLPRTSLDGSIDTTRFSISLTSRFLENGRFDVSYRYDERDNSTVQDTWNRVITDQIISGDLEQNIPYSFERTYFSVSGDYDLFDDSIRLSAGYDRREMDRDFQEVASQDEDTGWGRVRWRPTRSLDIDVRGGTSKRDVDVYDEGIAASYGQNPLMRKYHLAYRYREFADLTFTWSPLEMPLSISVNGLWADDSYSRSELGLLSGEELSLTADLSWSFTETGSLYVNVGSDSIESIQAGSEFFADPDWLATNEDEFTTIGAGLRLAQIGERFDLQLDYTRSEGETDILIDSAAGMADTFPTLKNEIDYLRLNLGFRQSERIGWNFNVSYQQFEARDWALQGVAPDAIPNVLSLGAQPYDEDALWVGVGFRYSM
jgi:MtrB/PioB family decaheme-associated outer membrane protein